MTTIKDIAKIAGVSQSTVSKALNNRHDISECTKDKILKIVEEQKERIRRAEVDGILRKRGW